jgi:hypothetical protein
MDHFKIIKRAFQITWFYRALWIFGFILALTAGGSSGGGGGGGGNGGSGSNGLLPPGMMFPGLTTQELVSIAISLCLALVCLALLLIVVFVIARYVAETAVMRMVDHHETTGEQVGVRQGFRWGWSRPAARLFVIDFLIGVGMLVAILLLALIAAAPLLLWLTNVNALRTIGTIGAIGLGLALFTLWILAAIVLSVLRQFFYRACVLEGLGVDDSFRRGFALARQRALDALIIALILFGIGLGWFILMIPIFILLAIAGALLGGLPGLAIGFGSSLFLNGAWPWAIGALVALPIFLLVFVVPLVFLNGLLKVFISTTWTLTYREARALESPPIGAAGPPAGGLEPGLESNIPATPEALPEVAPEATPDAGDEDLANL